MTFNFTVVVKLRGKNKSHGNFDSESDEEFKPKPKRRKSTTKACAGLDSSHIEALLIAERHGLVKISSHLHKHLSNYNKCTRRIRTQNNNKCFECKKWTTSIDKYMPIISFLLKDNKFMLRLLNHVPSYDHFKYERGNKETNSDWMFCFCKILETSTPGNQNCLR